MSHELKISRDVSLVTELTTRRSAIFGISGSGKSNTATRILELLLAAGEQIVLIDPKGEGWGLQTSADGKSPGQDVIVFGPPRGDIDELREEHAEQIADFVVDSGRSVVLSLLGFDSDQAERRFVTNFCKRLYRRKSQLAVKTRTLVALEEAHLFVPEQATGNAAEMVGAIKRIARQGRSAGLGLMLIDQRPQDVAKSVLTQSELLICHQLVHKLDRDALREWVRAYDNENQGEQFLGSLAQLQPGEAWVWSPAWLKLFVRTKIDRRHTYDSGATPDGSPAVAPKAKVKVDLDALRGHLARVVQEQKANDPAALRKRIADLEAELTTTHAAPPEPTIKEVPAIDPELVDRVQFAANTLSDLAKGMEGWREELAKRSNALTEAIGLAVQRAIPLSESAGKSLRSDWERVRASRGASASEDAGKRDRDATRGNGPGDPSVGKGGLRRILIALANRPGGLQPRQIAVRAGLSIRGGSFGTYLSRAKTAGWVVVDLMDNRLVITKAGREALGSFEALPVGRKLVDHWLGELGNSGAARILAVLVDVYAAALSKAELAKMVDMEVGGGSFGTYLSRLRSLELIEGTTHLKASAELFAT